jgi:uncharacterized protein (DUF2141 family)
MSQAVPNVSHASSRAASPRAAPSEVRLLVAAFTFAAILTLVALLAFSACAPRTSTTVTDDITNDIAGLETELFVEPTTFAVGDSVRVTLTLTNLTDRTLRVSFLDRRQIGLAVHDMVGDLLYVDDFTISVPTYLPLATFETWERTIQWAGRVRQDRNPVGLWPGSYQLQAGLKRWGDILLNKTNMVPIEVVAPGGE